MASRAVPAPERFHDLVRIRVRGSEAPLANLAMGQRGPADAVRVDRHLAEEAGAIDPQVAKSPGVPGQFTSLVHHTLSSGR